MNFDEFKKLTDKKKSINPVWFALDADEIKDNKYIKKIECKLNAKLPLGYVEFILIYGGGYFAFSNVFSLDEKSDWYILSKNRVYKDIAQNYVLFSENGSGDFYGFEIKDGECLSQVSFYDHECHSWNKTQYSNIFEYLEKYALMNGE